MKKTILIFNFIIVTSFAQVAQEWVSVYKNYIPSSDYAYDMTVDALGNIYITGQVEYGQFSSDYVTIKYSNAGIQQWASIYNGTANGYDVASSIALDRFGNVFVTGYSTGIGSMYDIATIKYNSQGVQQWAQRFNGSGNRTDEGTSIALDENGDVYVTGRSEGSVTTDDFITIKYNNSGTQLWAVIYNGSGNNVDISRAIKIDKFGNIYISGSSWDDSTHYDYVTIKYNSSGVQQWLQKYNGPDTFSNSDNVSSMDIDAFGNVYITGHSTGLGTNYDFATLKYNTNGVQQWVQRYSGPGRNHDYARAITVDHSGNVYVTGSIRNGTIDYGTIKYNSTGVMQWIQIYDAPGAWSDDSRSVAVDLSGNVYVTGTIRTVSSYDFGTIKYNSSGVQQWIQTYNGYGLASDGGYKVIADSLGNIYVTGYGGSNGFGLDYTTIKYSQLVGIKPISNNIPEYFSLSQNYPNPFNPTTKLRFSIPPVGDAYMLPVQIIVFDALGREVATLVNEGLSPGTYEVEFDGSNLSSGVYYYHIVIQSDKLIAGDYSSTKKMILVK